MFTILSLVELAQASSSSDPGPLVWLVFLPFLLFWIIWLGMYLLIFAIAVGGTIFWVIMLVDLAQRDFKNKDDQVVWLLVVVLTHWVGALIYYFMGRKLGKKRQ
ncbi:MAG: PLDc N-terminal domain-containing protein [Patescibacteria group bacterium]